MFVYFLLQSVSNLFYFALQLTGSSSFPLALSKEEEEKYLAAYKNGDNDAKNKLIEHNLRLVAHIAKKYYNSSFEQEDLISIGTIGLIKAVTTFNNDKGNRLAAYASRCIENEILMYFRNIKKSGGYVSICDPIDSDGEGNSLTIIDVLYNSTSIEDTLETKQLIEKLYENIDTVLSKREKVIINLRYGLSGQKTYTQKEVAKILGISRSYVSRIEKKAIKLLSDKFK